MSKKKISNKKDYTIPVLGGVLAIVLLVMIVALASPKEGEKGEFVAPAFERAAMAGIPDVPDDFGYGELYQDGMAYRFSVCGNVKMDGRDAIVYFTSPESNEKWMKLRILDTEGNILGETGLIKPGEYVEAVELAETLPAGTSIRLKIMGYEPDTYESAGSAVLNTQIGGGL